MKRLILGLMIALSFCLGTPSTARGEATPPAPGDGPQVPSPTPTPAPLPDSGGAKSGTQTPERPPTDSEIRLEPVIWLPTIDGSFRAYDPRLQGDRTFQGTITPSQVLPKLNFLLSGRAEGRVGRWGGFGELFYINASDDARLRSYAGSYSTKLTIGELAGFYRITGRIPIDLIAGVRLGTITNTLDFNGARIPQLGNKGIYVSGSYTHVDPIIGARVTVPLGRSVAFQLHGDYGGFGIGDNQRTWRLQGVFGIDASSRTRYLLGYGAVNFSADRTSGLTLLKSNVTFRGPIIGASFRL